MDAKLDDLFPSSLSFVAGSRFRSCHTTRSSRRRSLTQDSESKTLAMDSSHGSAAHSRSIASHEHSHGLCSLPTLRVAVMSRVGETETRTCRRDWRHEGCWDHHNRLGMSILLPVALRLCFSDFCHLQRGRSAEGFIGIALDSSRMGEEDARRQDDAMPTTPARLCAVHAAHVTADMVAARLFWRETKRE